MTVTAVTDIESREPSCLFYQTRARRPVVARAEGIHIWDRDGRRYIDGSSGAMVANIGHGNPRVLAAMRRQMEDATFAYRLHFENEAAEMLARRIAARMPAHVDRVFFVSGGSEAVESCLKLARQHALASGQASRYKVISRFPSYHGATLGALAITGYAPMTAPFAPMMREMPKVPAPTCYLDNDDLDWDARGLRYAETLREEIRRQGPETVLAFIMEPVGGASTGALVAPDSYYGRIREICDEYGVLLILDEVMSGVGRTGRFLAAEHWHLRPDIVALSKGFAAGYAPLGAMDPGERLQRLDLENLERAFLYPTLSILWVAECEDEDLTQAYLRAYNRWIVDFCSDSGGRLLPVAQLSLGDVEAAKLVLGYACGPPAPSEPPRKADPPRRPRRRRPLQVETQVTPPRGHEKIAVRCTTSSGRPCWCRRRSPMSPRSGAFRWSTGWRKRQARWR